MIPVAAAVVTATAGCGDGSGGLPSADFLLRGARASSGDMSSAHVDMKTTGSIPGLAVRSLNADVRAADDSEPGASYGTAAVAGMPVQFVEQDGRMYSKAADGRYQPAPEQVGGGRIPLPSSMIDPDHGLTGMLANFREPRTEVRETVDGKQAFRVTGTVPQADAAAWLPAIAGDANLTVWFATTGRHLPVRTRLTVPETGATISVALSDLNRKVDVPPAD